jgi:D-inositol-3-phosphate glycosyltransferase
MRLGDRAIMHRIWPHPHRIALLSAHTCPLAPLGGHKAGGLNVYVRETAVIFGRRGYLVDIFTRRDALHPEVLPLAPGVRVVHLDAGPAHTVADKDALWEYMPAFLHGLRAFRARHGLHYDLVHSHYWMSAWAATYLQRLWDVPHVAMFHTLGEAKNRARAGEHEPPHRIQTERRVVATADAVVAASEHERGLLVDLYHAHPERIEVIPCGVDPVRFHPLERTACRRELGLGAEPVVLFVGRLEPLKGAELLIDALARLDGATLVVVGGDTRSAGYQAELQRRAARRGVAARVRFEGAVPQERLPLYYNAADVCAVPSFYESFGLVALEAMACGIPVVAARVGGLSATVRDGENGYLVPWRDPAVFAERIGALLRDPSLRGRMGRAARVTAERFTWAGVSQRLEDLYVRLLQTRAATACHAAGEPVADLGEHAFCHIG